MPLTFSGRILGEAYSRGVELLLGSGRTVKAAQRRRQLGTPCGRPLAWLLALLAVLLVGQCVGGAAAPLPAGLAGPGWVNVRSSEPLALVVPTGPQPGLAATGEGGRGL